MLDWAQNNKKLQGTDTLKRLEGKLPISIRQRAMTTNQFLELCKTGSVQEISAALESVTNVNARNVNCTTALMWAAEECKSEVISILLKAGADVNSVDKDGMTALMMAAGEGMSEVISMLLRAGADINAKDKNGNTALDVALSEGNEAVVKLLKAAMK